MLGAGAWYLLCGLAALTRGDARAQAPWTMGLAFGVGQLFLAAILYTSQHATNEDPDACE